jgi:CS domain
MTYAAEYSRNGAVCGDSYCWSQTATDVVLSVIVPHDTRARDVTVSLTRAQAGRTHVVRVALRGQAVVEGTLAMPVHVPQAGGQSLPGVTPDSAEAEDIDWALAEYDPPAEQPFDQQSVCPEHLPRRVVRITLRKGALPGGGPDASPSVVLWWPKCLADHPLEEAGAGIDTSRLVDRAATAERTQRAREAWQQVEAMFLEKVKTQQRVPIEME